MGFLTKFQVKCRRLTYCQVKACIRILKNWEDRLSCEPLQAPNPKYYKDKVILAPMVRIGFLPMRLLALQYGADLVYTDEIFAKRLRECVREENESSRLVRFVCNDTPCFETCPAERNKVILQLGASNPKEALDAAKLSKTGAFLLDYPDRIVDILITLVNNLHVPVTCKIRLLPEMEKTLELVRRIEGTGVSALAVHGRLRTERKNRPVHVDEIRQIAQTISIPVIANGGSLEYINNYEDILKFRESTSTPSVMVAQSAIRNPSVFRKGGVLPLENVVKEFILLALKYNLRLCDTMYFLRETIELNFNSKNCTSPYSEINSCENYEDLCELFNLEKFTSDEKSQNQFGDEKGIIKLDIAFRKGNYRIKIQSPKSILNTWAIDNKKPLPEYDTIRTHKASYISKLTFDGKTYTTLAGQRTRQLAEHASCVVCLRHIGLNDGRKTQTDPPVDVLNDSHDSTLMTSTHSPPPQAVRA